MIDVSQLTPRYDQRGAVVGMTGSGKTEFMRYACRRFENVLVIDVKGTIRWPGYAVHTRLRDVVRDDVNPRVIYRPIHDELIDDDAIDGFFQYAYERGSTFVGVDEVFGVTNEGREIPKHYHAILTRGRERNIGCISGTQRPKGIPMSVFSESEWIYTFRLKLAGDRERIQEVTGIDEDLIVSLADHEFFVSCTGRDFPRGPYRLDLPSKQNKSVKRDTRSESPRSS